MKKALVLSADEDLRQLSRYLWAQDIPHRISEQAGQQVLWVAKDEQLEQARAAYQHFAQGELAAQRSTARREPIRFYDSISGQRIYRSLRGAPVVSTLILASLLVTLLMSSNFNEMVYAWLRVGSPAYVVESHEYWRLVTPIFLHFSVMHLAFNLLLLWVFGQKIESRDSSLLMLGLVLCFAVISNMAQYWLSGSNFGGMSGVVYGILGYCWLWDRLAPRRAYGFPPALMGFMLFWLALGFTDITAQVGFGHMANAAHLAGLVAGLVSAAVLSQFLKPRRENT